MKNVAEALEGYDFEVIFAVCHDGVAEITHEDAGCHRSIGEGQHRRHLLLPKCVEQPRPRGKPQNCSLTQDLYLHQFHWFLAEHLGPRISESASNGVDGCPHNHSVLQSRVKIQLQAIPVSLRVTRVHLLYCDRFDGCSHVLGGEGTETAFRTELEDACGEIAEGHCEETGPDSALLNWGEIKGHNFCVERGLRDLRKSACLVQLVVDDVSSGECKHHLPAAGGSLDDSPLETHRPRCFVLPDVPESRGNHLHQ